MARDLPSRPEDTDADAERVQFELLRKASPAQRAGLAIRLTATVMALSRRALERQSPDASDEEIGLRFVALNYGADLAAELAAHLHARRP